MDGGSPTGQPSDQLIEQPMSRALFDRHDSPEASSLPPSRPAAGQSEMIAAVEESEARSLTFARVVRAVRRHLLLAIAVSATAAAAALLLWRHPPLYQATAVVRLAGARRDLSAGVAGVSG